MTKPNEYKTCGARVGSFVSAGFTDRNGYVSYRAYLYEKNIELVLMISEDDVISSVICGDGDPYAPFYNEDMRYNNRVYDKVVGRYNALMDGFVAKGLIEKVEQRVTNGCEIIQIKYHTDIDKLTYIDGKSDWIDLRAAEDVKLKAGEYRLISLGVSMKLPDGYEAHIVPRSSTFKNFGVIQTNHIGVVDASYCGDDDIWKFSAFAVRDTEIHKNDRICQFRIMKNQPKIIFQETDRLGNKSRGGIGSTGKN